MDDQSSEHSSDEEYDEEESEEESDYDGDGKFFISEDLSEEGLSWDELEKQTKKCNFLISEEMKREDEK